jgi:preprotein translocase SecE subunit
MSNEQRSGEPRVIASAAPAEGRSFFEIYKGGQGYYTRMGTAIGGGVLILGGADFLYRQLVFESNAPWTLWVQVGVPLAAAVALGVLLYWVVGVNRRSCDFMIATEGEMKKVSWSNRRELIGSTKVVIVFSILIAALLFIVDVGFVMLFGWIRVLKVVPSLVKVLSGKA